MSDPEKDIETGPGDWDGPTKSMTNVELETKVGQLEKEVDGLKRQVRDLDGKVDECILDAREATRLMREAMASFSAAMPKLEQAVALLSANREAKVQKDG